MPQEPRLRLMSPMIHRASLLILSSLALAATSHAGYKFVTIDTPGQDATFVLDINNSGQWAGYAINFDPSAPGGGYYTALTGMADGTGRSVLTRPGAYSIGASGINSSGAISGVSVDSSFNAVGFVRSAGGVYSDINPATGGLTSAYSEAVDLNDNGMVVGFYNETVPITQEESSVNSHGFMLNNGVYSQVDFPGMGNHGTQLYSVNNAGVASGRYLDAAGFSHGFQYSESMGYVDTSIPGFLSTESDGINNLGQYTAVAYLDPTNPYAVASFIYTGGTYVPFSVPGSLATVAYSLNDHGQVVGVYVGGDFKIHGFTATVVPAPMACAPFVLGGLAHLRRRRKA